MRALRGLAAVLFSLALALPAAAAAKVFNVNARRFTYDISPSPFVVDEGDTVTVNVTAVDDGQGFGHGFFIEHYAEDQNQVLPGSPITIQFTADTAGTFIVFCTIVCGIDHPSMNTEFTVVAAPNQTPSVSSFSPDTGSTSGGDVVTINGASFRNGATVDFGGTPATQVTFVSASRLDVVTPAHAPGVVAITVTNPGGMSATAEGAFTFDEAALLVTKIAPTSGSAGTLVTITGAGFSGGTGLTVTFGGVVSTNVHVVNDRTLTAVAPTHAAGAVEVVVSATNGSASATFDYQAASRRRAVRTP
ncbi:MAG TPA: IPT/TIG domain-containing protein [Thermoanaerobaculia bacterium]|nr:IPT/TIG domain-containing protein [Thermoanaerobaculia bacterium]